MGGADGEARLTVNQFLRVSWFESNPVHKLIISYKNQRRNKNAFPHHHNYQYHSNSLLWHYAICLSNLMAPPTIQIQ